MDNIILDKSGKLIPGIFYEFGIPSSDIPNDLAAEDPRNGWIVVERTPNGEELERTPASNGLVPLSLKEHEFRAITVHCHRTILRKSIGMMWLLTSTVDREFPT